MAQNKKEIRSLLASEREKLFDFLLRNGCSAEEAMRTMDTVFDWELREVMKPLLRSREDEFADSEKKRMAEAENGRDFCQIWLCLKLGGAPGDLLDLFTVECSGADYLSMCVWVFAHGLTEIFEFGSKVYAVEANEDPECR